jgi:hypothetical protein
MTQGRTRPASGPVTGNASIVIGSSLYDAPRGRRLLNAYYQDGAHGDEAGEAHALDTMRTA